MNHHSTSSLIQQWFVVTDDTGANLLVARWVSDTGRNDAAGIA